MTHQLNHPWRHVARFLAGVLLLGGTPAWGQGEYKADDAPTALEEEIRWLVNRGRFDSARENAARQTSYTDVPATAPPLAPHQALAVAARRHSEDMGRQNAFQHETVSGSAYYNPNTQPSPWDRMKAEGYNWTGASENIAAGYGSALAAYVGWWNSTGHRKNMYDPAMREIGNGHFAAAGSRYAHYYTMDLGRSGSSHFLTDTLFHDRDGDGSYDQGEGVAGVRLTLAAGGTEHGAYDVSSGVGSFAIPIQALPNGAPVDVWLHNTTQTPVSLTLPRDYARSTAIVLAGGESKIIGTFTQPQGVQNVGFRNLTPPADPPPIAPLLHITANGPDIELRWPSEPGVLYQPQISLDLVRWTDTNDPELPGTGGELRVVHPGPTAARPSASFRVLLRRP